MLYVLKKNVFHNCVKDVILMLKTDESRSFGRDSMDTGMCLFNLKSMHHCYRKNDPEWMRSGGSAYTSKDVRYNSRTKIA